MKRLFLLVSILLLVGGAGGAGAEENPPATEMPLVGLDIQSEVGDLIALGPLVPGKLREVCAIVGFTPKVKPEMTGVFCYPTGKKGAPARNGYINIYLAWGKLAASGGGRWTGANKLGPWQSKIDFSDPRQKGWTFWVPEAAWPLWEKYPGNGAWPQPVFTKAQLQGRITKTIYGTPEDDPGAHIVGKELGFTEGFATGMKLGGFNGYGEPRRLITCGFLAGRFALQVGTAKRALAMCGAPHADIPHYVLRFWEPWGFQDRQGIPV